MERGAKWISVLEKGEGEKEKAEEDHRQKVDVKGEEKDEKSEREEEKKKEREEKKEREKEKEKEKRQSLKEWKPQGEGPHLVALSSQCNWSGYRIDLKSAISEIKSKITPMPNSDKNISSTANSGNNIFILVDAASSLSSAPLDLTLEGLKDADFVTVSLYKWLGYPTGLGCLLIRNTAIHILVCITPVLFSSSSSSSRPHSNLSVIQKCRF